MAQLIKCQDYISRYEMDIYRYPSQYVRLKKQHWDALLEMWLKDEWPENETIIVEETKISLFTKMREFVKKKPSKLLDSAVEEKGEERPAFTFLPHLSYVPDTEEELKQFFLDQLYSFQLTWASSTFTQRSIMDRKYQYDPTLRYLLQRFPDTFLVLYEPILLIKKAPVECHTILISPTDVWCIVFLEGKENEAYIGSKERFWEKKFGDSSAKVLNPVVALNRMESIVHSIFQHHQVDLPIKKVVISRTGYVDYPSPQLI
ncbi:NERD domain-containing protein [Mangrovibacillus cuniculi]|uniref:NERD domain-containing protein n=1 Tax=Mangrovibacillus cuniculi TaxID=2593652 RepID=UPI001EFA1E22|nr:NERD domain-containing protein [Mangrovibacillus cuniculi]